MNTLQKKLRSRLPGLVWSNPKAPQEAYVRAALLRPRFLQILDIVAHIGLKETKQEWAALEKEGTLEAKRAKKHARFILKTITQASA